MFTVYCLALQRLRRRRKKLQQDVRSCHSSLTCEKMKTSHRTVWTRVRFPALSTGPGHLVWDGQRFPWIHRRELLWTHGKRWAISNPNAFPSADYFPSGASTFHGSMGGRARQIRTFRICTQLTEDGIGPILDSLVPSPLTDVVNDQALDIITPSLAWIKIK